MLKDLDHSIISLVWVWAWFRAEQGPRYAPGMQSGCDHLGFGGHNIASTFAGIYINPRAGVRTLSTMEQREEDDDDAMG